MRTYTRILGLLDRFDEHSSAWTFDKLYQDLGYPRSTLYRYLKVLTDAGLLTSLPDEGYTLGPRIIELDYRIRTSDPLIRAARPVMKELVREVPGVALLCRRYRQKVLCVHQESSTDDVHSRYERGLARPLLRGAASVVILAYLPAGQIAKLYKLAPRDIEQAGLGASLAEVRAALKACRKKGWVTTTGQVTAGVTGIAAPIFDARRDILGSLSLSVPQASVDDDMVHAIAERLLVGSRSVTGALAR